jgi:hypothetical protein
MQGLELEAHGRTRIVPEAGRVGTLFAVRRVLASPDEITFVINQETAMKLKKLLPWAVAAAFAVPSTILAQSSSSSGDAGAPPSGASGMGTSPKSGGSPSPQSAGEPKAPTAGARSGAATSGTTSRSAGSPSFSAIDKNGDGNISRAEWDAYQRSAGAASGGATTSPSGSATTSSGSGKTGTTAGPGEASPRTAPGSASATKPDTSGQGKAQ